MNRQDITIIVAMAIIAILIFIRVVYLVNLGGNNSEYTALLTKTQEIKRENISLKSEILHEASLTEIERKAKDMGYLPVTYYFLK